MFFLFMRKVLVYFIKFKSLSIFLKKLRLKFEIFFLFMEKSVWFSIDFGFMDIFV